MELNLTGKGLFVFSDPGGAKPVLALVKSLADQLTDYLIISDRVYPFYEDFCLIVNQPRKDITIDLDLFKPDFIFTGTSYTSDIEFNFIIEGKKRGIPTFSFVDHWTSIRERFSKKGTEVLPDKICVIDEKAKRISLAENISEVAILIVGNPFQEYLRSWKPKITRDDFFNSLGLKTNDKKIIVFAPDPLSNVNGKNTFGFDEIQVFEEIGSLLDDILQKYLFIFKPHPNQNLSVLNQNILRKMYIANNEIDNNCLIYYSDIIIGFFSNYLIEASIMQKKILRYLPGNTLKDPLSDISLGTIVNKTSLIEHLN